MTQPITVPVAEEFADLLTGRHDPGTPVPTVQRRWVTVATGGHVSGVFWDTPAPELLLLHDLGASARAWDGLLLALDRPAVAVDLPGHGRSSRRSRPDHRPRRLAAGLAQAVHSFAPPGVPAVGRGLGALAAVAVTAKAPGVLGRLVLLDTLPGSLAATWPDDTWTEADDDVLWEQLAAAPDPVLVRTDGGSLDAALADRFRSDVPNGVAVTAGPAPDSLAAVLRELLP